MPYAGVLGQRTIPRQNTLFPYPLLVGSNAAVNLSQATADYHAMILRVNRRFAERHDAGRDLHLVEGDRQHRHRRRQPGLQRRGQRARRDHSLYDFDLNRRLGYSDIPHRLVATFLYELPFGKGKPIGASNQVVSALLGGWQVSGSAIWQTGFPLAIPAPPTARRCSGPIASRAWTSCCPRTSGLV